MSIIGAIMGNDPGYNWGDQRFWPVTQGRQTTAGEWVSGETALALPVYWACIQAISMDLAKLSLHVYRRDGSNKVVDDSHYLGQLLRDEPNPEMSALTFFETLTAWAAGWGNGYAEKVMNGAGQPVELWPIHPSRVEVKRTPRGALYYRVRRGDDLSSPPSADADELSPDEMFHLRGMGDGVQGISVFRAASESIGYAMAARRAGAAFFGNGLNVNYVLQHPDSLSDEALKHLRESLEHQHSGAKNAFRPFIAEEGMTLQKMSVDPKEAQVLEVLEFQIEEVCRWFRMPPHKVQHMKRATFSNIEHQGIEYVVDTMLPWVRRWETEIRRKLLLPGDRGTHFVEFNMETLLRADSKARAEFYEIMQRNGNYTINMVLEKENINSIGPAGDQRFVPLNMTTAERMLAGPPDPQKKPTGRTDGRVEDDDEDDDEARAVAITAMFYPELSRAVKRQAAQLTAAAKKHRGDAAAFNEWVGKFYDGGPRMTGLNTELADTLGQIGQGVARLTGIDGAAETAKAFAADHCRRMADTMRQAFSEEAEALVAEAWERDGLAAGEAGKLAAAIVVGAS